MLSVLKKHDFDGKGGVLLSELNECVQNADALAKVHMDMVDSG